MPWLLSDPPFCLPDPNFSVRKEPQPQLIPSLKQLYSGIPQISWNQWSTKPRYYSNFPEPKALPLAQTPSSCQISSFHLCTVQRPRVRHSPITRSWRLTMVLTAALSTGSGTDISGRNRASSGISTLPRPTVSGFVPIRSLAESNMAASREPRRSAFARRQWAQPSWQKTPYSGADGCAHALSRNWLCTASGS